MRKKQISIRDVPEALYEWIEAERHAKRISQKDFLLRVLENAASHSQAATGTAGPSAFSKMTLVYWKSKKFWLGKLLEHPEIMTQGRTLGNWSGTSARRSCSWRLTRFQRNTKSAKWQWHETT